MWIAETIDLNNHDSVIKFMKNQSDKIKKLEEENEQLKSEYKVLHTQYQDLKKFVENNFDEYLTQEKLNRQIIKLSDENEQLKKDIEYYKTERLALFEYLDKKDDLKLELKVKK